MEDPRRILNSSKTDRLSTASDLDELRLHEATDQIVRGPVCQLGSNWSELQRKAGQLPNAGTQKRRKTIAYGVRCISAL